MKKITAIILSVLCLCSCLGITSFAATDDIFGGIINDFIGVTEEEDISDEMNYGIHYEMQPLSTVKLMYKPNPTFTFKAPTTAKVTNDTPLSADYEFVCWKHSETGELYYPGDTIEVTGIVTLYAVFEEKTDNYPSLIRYIITGLEVFNRLLKQFLGITDALEENDKEYFEPTTTIA